MLNHIHKVWGERRRIFENDMVEVDLLTLKAQYRCSVHFHAQKFNRFVVITGKVVIQTEYGIKTLLPTDSFDVLPFILHRFHAVENSQMIEIAWVDNGILDEDDIKRSIQGGLFDVHHITEDELRGEGRLEL